MILLYIFFGLIALYCFVMLLGYLYIAGCFIYGFICKILGKDKEE